MRSNGSAYVAVVFALLIAYFSYQWWFNPNRAVKRRLGELAATLSVPANETDLRRVTRLAQLRGYLADNIHVRAGRSQPEISSRDAVMVAVGGWTPPAGWNVDFVDTDVKVDSDSTARAFVTADMTTRDAQTGEPLLDSREAQFSMAYLDGEWLVRDVDVKDPPQRPSPR